MKLVSIISTWADTLELLPFCIDNHLQFCDAVIVVGSLKSNHNVSSVEYARFIERRFFNDFNQRVIFEYCEPIKGLKPLTNETRKRNFGLSIAKAKGFTHFLIADADEFYDANEMSLLKEKFEGNGYIHPVRAYLTPTLYCEDHTLVCGIHRLAKDVYCGNFPYYPFTYVNSVAHIDPSRRLSFKDGIQKTDVVCHHYTLVRKNIDLKINNSTANSLKKNRQVIYDEIKEAKPGQLSKLYHKPIKESENIFDLCI
jgi:hypothetical protein